MASLGSFPLSDFKSALSNDTSNISLNVNATINQISPDNNEIYRIVKDEKYVRSAGQPDTNIICPGVGSACLPEQELVHLLSKVEIARRKGFTPSVAEKQPASGSGIFMDIDLYQPTSMTEYQYTPRFFISLIKQIFMLIQNMFDLSVYQSSIRVGVTLKRTMNIKEIGGDGSGIYCNSAGFHILIPGLKLTRGAKHMLFNKIIERRIIENVVAQHGIKTVNPDTRFFDIQCKHVVSFLVGCGRIDKSTGKQKPVHELTYVFEVDGHNDPDGGININTDSVVVPTNPAVCLVLEFSLNTEAPTTPNYKPFIRKMLIHPKPQYIAEVERLSNKNTATLEDFNEEMAYQNELDLSAKLDPGMNYIQDMVGMINNSHAFKYTDTWKIIQALANMDQKYKGIAEEFVKRFPEKYISATHFNKRWNEALSSANIAKMSGQSVLKMPYIESIARKCNPEKYKAVKDKYQIHNLLNMILDKDNLGKFEHAHIAQIIWEMKRDEYVVDYPEGSKTPVWYKLMLPEDRDLLPGETFKWKEFIEPTWLYNMITYVLYPKFKSVYSELHDKIKKMIANPAEYERPGIDTSGLIKFYESSLKSFTLTCKSLMNAGFRASVVRESRHLFAKAGFTQNLDNDEMLMGVGNGILCFGTNGYVSLIDHIHDHKVSVASSTPVNWKRFDPRDPITKTMLLCMRSMFTDSEGDKFDLVMNFACLGLTGKQKPSKMIFLYGSGRNGKSYFMEQLRNVFGGYGGKGPANLIVGTGSSNADSASPAVFAIKGKRFMSYGECGPGQSLNVPFFKEILGGEKQTARKLYGDLVTFYANCVHFLPLNNLLKILNTDYATWRRVMLVKLNIKFFNRHSPDYNPLDPNHRIEDKYINNPKLLSTDPLYLEAFLGYLVYMWERLQIVYDGNLDLIRCPHVLADTAEYRSTQDIFDDFINRRFVKTGTPDRFAFDKISLAYTAWLTIKGHNTRGMVMDDLEVKLRDSKISDFLKTDRMGKYLVGYRFLMGSEDPRPNETYVFNIDDQKTDEEKDKEFAEGKTPLVHDANIAADHKKARDEMASIPRESPEDFYERVCREYDAHEQRRAHLGNILTKDEDKELDEINRQIAVGEHEDEVKRIRQNFAERQATEQEQQAQKMREGLQTIAGLALAQGIEVKQFIPSEVSKGEELIFG